MKSRREFITNMLIGASAMSVFPISSFANESKSKLKRIGFISGILNNQLKEMDWKFLLEKSVEYGFTEYEGGVMGNSTENFLQFCKGIGLKPVAGAVKMTDDKEMLKKDFDTLNALDMKYAVVYWPWKSKPPFNLEACKRSADMLNYVGSMAKEEGLRLCWHNHDKEFVEMEQGLPFDYLMQHTDKKLVGCEMDIYWVAKGGANPLQLLKKYEDRIPILHVKDMASDAEKSITCPGSGVIDFAAIFSEAKRLGIQHYFVERDKAEDGLACLESSGKYLLNLRF